MHNCLVQVVLAFVPRIIFRGKIKICTVTPGEKY